MKITVLSDQHSWINSRMVTFLNALKNLHHAVQHIHTVDQLEHGDLCFVLSFSSIIKPEMLSLNKHTIVIHESNLPEGKGWSPLTWQIIEGKNRIPITLLEASAEKIDAGKVYLRDHMEFSGHELVEELRDTQARVTFELCLKFCREYPRIIQTGAEQTGKSSYYKRRTHVDSQLDVKKSLEEQFDLLRTVDNNKYPAYFEMRGHKYLLKIEKTGAIS